MSREIYRSPYETMPLPIAFGQVWQHVTGEYFVTTDTQIRIDNSNPLNPFYTFSANHIIIAPNRHLQVALYSSTEKPRHVFKTIGMLTQEEILLGMQNHHHFNTLCRPLLDAYKAEWKYSSNVVLPLVQESC
ncbi:MAG: hypothetical protein ACEQSA_03495 [Weeksellaceae bacterium]